MRVGTLAWAGVALAASLGSIACRKNEPPAPTTTASASPAEAPAPVAVAEELPRCRAEGAKLDIAGEDVVVGDAVVAGDALFTGLVRREGTKRAASILRTGLDLGSPKFIEIGPALGDDPPPVPYGAGNAVFAAYFARKAVEPSPKAARGVLGTRELRLVRLDASSTFKLEGSVVQQADESQAFDVAWTDPSAAPLVAWDEDAPLGPGRMLADRGVIKVQALTPGAKPLVASPDTSDAESPRLLPRKGGYWLAWLATKPEVEDAGAPSKATTDEGPGERRAFRWLELVTLDAKGETTSKVRRISSEKGRAASFELSKGAAEELVVVLQDEAAATEGAGARVLRYVVTADRVEPSDLVDGGVGTAPVELVPAAAPRWLAWTDVADHARVLSLSPGVLATTPPTLEPALDPTRVLAFAPPSSLFGLSQEKGQIVRFTCP
ncbi:hypothetical protein AKJ09_07594 [Labilithrix luteola]|uniref:Lipoprotein n=1 Tax=Labilithrix luteola TaxID=1391654 RepID=A0A0K1Q516_9BACT|nr:hypothetical protein [Labilithrix luteola]AKV00931.1 hypothetical protein AKJ09_07594 [Labilithrix luteola]